MAKVGAQRAAELTGRSKSTIQRAMNSGKLSYEVDSNGRRLIDVSELDRAFGLMHPGNAGMATAASPAPSIEAELEKAASMLEAERLKMRVRMLEEQLETAHTHIEDLKGQRDQWQKQASQVLITSQYSQKQAEELRAELRERDRRARERREQTTQKMDQPVKRLRPQNENAPEDKAAAEDKLPDTFSFKALWKRAKGVA